VNATDFLSFGQIGAHRGGTTGEDKSGQRPSIARGTSLVRFVREKTQAESMKVVVIQGPAEKNKGIQRVADKRTAIVKDRAHIPRKEKRVPNTPLRESAAERAIASEGGKTQAKGEDSSLFQ